MENKFTPGPWFPVEYAGYWNIQTTPYYQEKADVMDADNVGIEQAEANAKLIAAAPELLEALLTAKSLLEMPSNEVTRADMKEIEDAIKKATE